MWALGQRLGLEGGSWERHPVVTAASFLSSAGQGARRLGPELADRLWGQSPWLCRPTWLL